MPARRGIGSAVRERRNIPWYRGTDVFRHPELPIGITRERQELIDFHAHDFFEIVVVAAGTGLNQLKPVPATGATGAETVRSYSFFQGDVFSIPPGCQHSYRLHHDLRLYNVMFDPSILGEAAAELAAIPALGQLLFGERTATDRRKLHWSPSRLRRELERLDCLWSEIRRFEAGARIKARALLLAFLVDLGRSESEIWHHSRQPDGPDGSELAVRRAIVLMNRRLNRPLPLSELAAEVRLSPHYFCEQFRRCTGLPPGEYLIRLRLERAREQLAGTSASIDEIARAAGFNDHSHFTRSFRKREGLTPSDYRRQCRNGQTR